MLACLFVFIGACQPSPPKPIPEQRLIVKGRDLFFKETFKGNGRTCGSCHRAENNFVIDPVFMVGLPKDDPLFAAEFVPELKTKIREPKAHEGVWTDSPKSGRVR